MKTIRSILLASALATTTGSTAFAAENAIDGAALADGKPWRAALASGRRAVMTFEPGGGGALKVGPFSMDLKWRMKSERFCLFTKRTGERCATLERTAGGYRGTNRGAVAFELRR